MNEEIRKILGADLDGLVQHADAIAEAFRLTEAEKAKLLFYIGYLTVKEMPGEVESTNEEIVRQALKIEDDEICDLLGENRPESDFLVAGIMKGLEENSAIISA